MVQTIVETTPAKFAEKLPACTVKILFATLAIRLVPKFIVPTVPSGVPRLWTGKAVAVDIA
jgi:hypothetical protein